MHVLVCTAFHGPPPDDMVDATVDHINRIRDDNSSINLRWADREKQGTNRLGVNRVVAISATTGLILKHFNSPTAAAREWNIHAGSIMECCRTECKGRRKSAGMFEGQKLKWRYVK